MNSTVFCALLLLVCGVLAVSGGMPPFGGRQRKAISNCPPNVPVAMCFFDPCEFASCALPSAKCRLNTCGGCFADWVDSQNNIVTACTHSPYH